MTRAVIAIALAGCAAFAATQPSAAFKIDRPNAADIEAASNLSQEELRGAVEDVQRILSTGDCEAVLARLDPLLPRAGGDMRTILQFLRAPCLADLRRNEDFEAVYRELAEAAPDNPQVMVFGVIAALNGDRQTEAAQHMIALAEQHPGQLGQLNSWALRSILQDLAVSENYELRDRLNIALAEADWQPPDLPDMRETIAAGAIDAHLKDGNSDAAGALMDRIESPMTLTTMAIDRHYEPLWPAIEETLGAEQGRAIDLYARARLDGYANNGGDSAALRDAVIAYRLLGRLNMAAEIAERATVSADMDEATFVTARIRAGTLIALGEDDAAIAILESVTSLDPQVTPFVPSAYVSLAEFLDILHRPEAALAVARQGMAGLEGRLSAYGRSWLRRTEICALTALDRRDEAAPLAAALAGNREDNPAAAIEAQLCFGDDDRAAALAIATLETREGAEQIADQFLTDEMLGSGMTVYLRAMWQRLLARDDVREAFDRRLRLLPRELWPSTDPRPVPRREQVPTPPGLITT
ncbi:tetratricopeptide repeat protein [Parasphingopyxis marina]|uniref:Tetratricopeptide repeat protein n=1 Tax=Parasphingopyxis marina TaxID=2761622 RepID=A0A842I131_9SPHN|nr:hypothetical protein [Parasphingopyxis marina]MBC2778431.1 hypothetical protein [Parasphingopyxis marina]